MDSENTIDLTTQQAGERKLPLLKGWKRKGKPRAKKGRKVVRGFNFRTMLGEIEPTHNVIIKPVVNNARYPKAVQLCLFEKKTGGNVKMGAFYETMTMGLFGGKMCDTFFFEKGTEVDNPLYFCPDVVNKEKGEVWESKGVGVHSHLNLMDTQIERYRKYQIIHSNHTINWIIWRHDFKKTLSYKGSILDFHEEMSVLTLCAVIIPFTMIVKYHSLCDSIIDGVKVRSRTRRYEKDNWYHCTAVSNRELNRLFYKPEKVSEELEFPIEVERVRTSNNLYVEDQHIKPFCITIIKDPNYKEWAKEISEEIPF